MLPRQPKQSAKQSTECSQTNQLSCDELSDASAVVVWDQQQVRRQTVDRIIVGCEARAFGVNVAAEAQALLISFCRSVALVAAGGRLSPGLASLEIIRVLKQNGFKVICYEDGAHDWPLGVRCQALIAGATSMLDSAKPEFASELKQLLTELMRAEAEKRNEEAALKAVMRNLGIIGESREMVSVFRWVERLSMLSDLPTLITGETGTGKELLARAMHQLDPKRRTKHFVALNCGAISPGLAESELFGHRRGAFTGADRDRRGLIRAAEDGVLFLDEIGELDDALQVKLLRVLQESCVLGLGEDREMPINVRIIAATNRNLEEMVQQGKFRADLYHRLSTLSVHVPALSERRDDYKPLIEHFLKKYQALRPDEIPVAGVDFIEALMLIELPGNARQLENIVRRALVNKAGNGPLGLSDLPPEVWRALSAQMQNALPQTTHAGAATGAAQETPVKAMAAAASATANPTATSAVTRADLHAHLSKLLDSNNWNLSQSLDHCEKLIIESALQQTHGNQSDTARLLGITPRSVYNKVRKHHLH